MHGDGVEPLLARSGLVLTRLLRWYREDVGELEARLPIESRRAMNRKGTG
jgi:hypothetical protein